MITYLIERVSDHGYISNGHRLGRKATVISSTQDPSKVEALRQAAKATIKPGSADWISVSTEPAISLH